MFFTVSYQFIKQTIGLNVLQLIDRRKIAFNALISHQQTIIHYEI